MKTIKIFALLFAIIIIAQSCRKESDNFTVTPPYTEPKISVVGSVLGTVIDDNGEAVEGAMVTFENTTVFTDEFGVFQINDESLYSSGTHIKVTKDGYFNGSRNFYPSSGKTSRVAIEMIPLNEVAEFSSAEGMKVNFEDVELEFKSNSIMNEDGSAFSGNVNVAAKYLDPTLIETMQQMPGDLTGTTTEQERVVLTSMAMITVELMDDSGNKLQVKEGNTVDVKIPVPESLQGNAPSTIPMWHFDEVVGTWVEEGSAVLVNGVYETSLPHFSFWNCDIPNDFIFLKGSIQNRGIPIQGVTVVVTVADGGASGSAITDADGSFCGYVPNGVDLILEVFDQCGNVIYTLNIPASEIDIVLNEINLSITTNVATISGSVALCDGTPSSSTFVNANQGALNNIIVINDDNTFEGNVFYCNQNDELLVGAIDPINALASPTSTYTLSGDLDVGEILLCEEQISHIVIYQYGDINSTWTYDGNANDSTFYTYTLNSLVIGTQGGEPLIKEIYTFTTLNWYTEVANILIFDYVEGQPTQNATVDVSEAGFRASGVASTQKIIQGGETYLVSTGTLSDIEIIDATIFDTSIDELFYYFALGVN